MERLLRESRATPGDGVRHHDTRRRTFSEDGRRPRRGCRGSSAGAIRVDCRLRRAGSAGRRGTGAHPLPGAADEDDGRDPARRDALCRRAQHAASTPWGDIGIVARCRDHRRPSASPPPPRDAPNLASATGRGALRQHDLHRTGTPPCAARRRPAFARREWRSARSSSPGGRLARGLRPELDVGIRGAVARLSGIGSVMPGPCTRKSFIRNHATPAAAGSQHDRTSSRLLPRLRVPGTVWLVGQRVRAIRGCSRCMRLNALALGRRVSVHERADRRGAMLAFSPGVYGGPSLEYAGKRGGKALGAAGRRSASG